MKPAKSKDVNIQGKRISYYDEGSNEDDIVLCLHGFAESKERYLRLIDKIKPYHRVLALDFPGHGSSDAYEGARLDLYVEIVKDFLDQLNIKTLNLVGFSMGGLISLMFTSKYPDIVKKMVIWESSVDFLSMKRFKLLKPFIKLLKNHSRVWDTIFYLFNIKAGNKIISLILGSDIAYSIRKVDPKTAYALLEDILSINFKNNLRNINKSTLLICGTGTDIIVAKRKMQEIEKAMPSARLIEIKGAQHFSKDASLVYPEILRSLKGELSD